MRRELRDHLVREVIREPQEKMAQEVNRESQEKVDCLEAQANKDFQVWMDLKDLKETEEILVHQEVKVIMD